MNSFTIDLPTIKTAYKKLKSYVYEDNTLLHLRIALSQYENDNLENKLDNIYNLLCAYQENHESIHFTEYLELIDYIILPKKYASDFDSSKNYYSNNLQQEKYIIENQDFNVFIDCPIELHIISVLWIMFIGEKLDNSLDSQISGYRLARNNDNLFEKEGYKLFQKYHEKYSYFRNSAITKAMELHQLNLDVTIINLDIKRFFYCINVNFSNMAQNIITENNFLNLMLKDIHIHYQEKLYADKIFEDNMDSILPIGFLSSSILANYALKEFDTFIQKNIKPENYTRYVDDILLVFSNVNIKNIDDLFKYLQCEVNKLNFKLEDQNINFQCEKNQFTLQKTKIKILEFKKDSSISLLKKFKKTIESNRSIFNFLPEEKNIFSTLEDVSININYSSTINKISSIEKSSLDVLSISRNLSQMIKIVLIIDHKNVEIEKYNNHLSNIFSGINLLELSKLWSKLFLYLILSKSFSLLKKLLTSILQAIQCIEHSNTKITTRLNNDLKKYLANSLLMSSSLHVQSFQKSIQPFLESKTKDDIGSLATLISIDYVQKYSKGLINSNLIHQYYIRFPLLNFTNDEKYSLVDKSLILQKPKIKIDFEKIEYSPRFIHYHELLLFNRFTQLKKTLDLKIIYNQYLTYNKKSNQSNDKIYPHTNNDIIEISSSQKFKNLKIGMANITVDQNDSISSMEGHPNLSYKKLNQIHHILNTAILSNCDLVVFPEMAIPIYWIQEIIEFSKRNEIAVIFGVEHFRLAGTKVVYNYSIVSLPFRDGIYKNVFVDFILKSIYSPAEKELIEGYGYKIPKITNKNMTTRPVYKYKNNYFSIFNCFELAEINYRAALVGKVDFVVAIEHNQDTNYFSNIVGSVSRDIHAYIIQVNDSRYGDSRITQPTKTEEMDIAKIKGGEDVVLLTATINIQKLREFQKKTYVLQSKDKSFKPTPPNFEIKVNQQRLS